MKLNLFGSMGYSLGVAETKRFMLLLVRDAEFRELFRSGIVFRDKDGCVSDFEHRDSPGTFSSVYLQEPFKWGRTVGAGYPWIALTDNGGELNAEWINRPDTLISVPYTWHRSSLNAETVYYRFMTMLEGDTPDWGRMVPPLTEGEATLLLVPKPH